MRKRVGVDARRTVAGPEHDKQHPRAADGIDTNTSAGACTDADADARTYASTDAGADTHSDTNTLAGANSGARTYDSRAKHGQADR